ncbi:fimbrial biogenesis usher protein [Escherichia coli]|uniref:fimbrial biogenesis usher protein n=1 Tax=Escherichia coli TaxID=562 RepID=UPI002941574C|nr:fimbrial biogenesis usher protein [Escherichia coli]MDV5030447.1 fimbrial biogenesis usher protein [Escherichia coli]MDV5075213.1 fimbrial biogenesis usher protein [Escherichia coli]MDX4968135.1 fimbrial biogenesis usher protein [Escherichia coli]
MYGKSYLLLTIRLFCGLAPFLILHSPGLMAREVTFDPEILRSRGLSPELNRYFSKTPRFLPGEHSVEVIVNGKSRGIGAVRFDDEGTLCINEDFLQFAGLMPVPLSGGEACHDIRQDYKQALVNAYPGQEKLEIYVPEQALNSLAGDIKNFQQGGTAGLLNYSLYSMRNEYENDNRSYSWADLEGGFNIADWAVRSRYMLTNDDNQYSTDSIYTYAERVFPAQRVKLQVGEINSQLDVLSGVPITGVQLLPASGLQGNGSGARVLGIAKSSQARVEIRQNGRLIYNTIVPVGPFTLDDVPVVSNNVDLDVTVSETDGSSLRYRIPASSYNSLLSKPIGLTVSAGRAREIHSEYEDPWLFTISDGWRVTPGINVIASGIAAQSYQAVGSRLETMINDDWRLFASLSASNEQFGDSGHGQKMELQSDFTINDSLRFSTSAAHYSSDFRELTDAMDDDYRSYDNSYSADVSWGGSLAGTFSLGFSYNQSSNSDYGDSRYILASWNKTFKYASVSVNWQTAVGSDDNDQDDDLLYMNISIPLGGSQSLTSYMQKQGDRTTYGVQNSGMISRNTYYSISTDHDNQSGDNRFNGNINTNLHYTQLSVGAGSNGDHSRNYNARLSGAIAMHNDGLTFSPYAIRQTFAIAKLNVPRSGVEIESPQGTIWTDVWGQAVIPGLNEWRRSRIEVNANKLPQSMVLANGVKYVAAGHGSVSEVRFNVLESRRVMLKVTTADGRPLAKGLAIEDEQGNYIVTSVDDGHVFLNDVEQVSELYVLDKDNRRLCQITYTLSDDWDKEAFYEQVNEVCR